ncbi:hypothetical protein AU375_04736 [Methylobacterium radiotolerans]|nr:hypothetical protein AU375_04736 [Methylobacterium radiotolerans]
MGQAQRPGGAADGLGLRARFRPQAVIHGGDPQGRAGRVAQARGGVHQGARVGTARDGEEHAPPAARGRVEPGAEGAEDRVARVAQIARGVQAPQRARFCSRATPWRTPLPAFGNFRSSSARVAQACSRAPSALSVTPSFSMASGAWEERA